MVDYTKEYLTLETLRKLLNHKQYIFRDSTDSTPKFVREGNRIVIHVKFDEENDEWIESNIAMEIISKEKIINNINGETFIEKFNNYQEIMMLPPFDRLVKLLKRDN